MLTVMWDAGFATIILDPTGRRWLSYFLRLVLGTMFGKDGSAVASSILSFAHESYNQHRGFKQQEVNDHIVDSQAPIGDQRV